MVKYHGLARRDLTALGFLMRPLLNAGTLGRPVEGRSDIQSRAARELCPALRRILELEVGAGNSVVALKDDWGFIVVLSKPFLLKHTLDSPDLTVREVNNRSEWKSEINSKEFKHTLACGFGDDWKPPSRIMRHRTLFALFLIYMLWRFVQDCTHR